MLGKLLKHEFQAAGRMMLPVWLALLVLGVFTNLATRIMVDSDALALNILGVLIVVLFVFGCVAASVMSIVTMVLRFQRSVLSREGYLTHTLPVGIHSLIWSRMIVAVVYQALTIGVIVGSTVIAIFQTGIVQEAIAVFRLALQELMAQAHIHGVFYIVEFVVMMLAGGLVCCLMFYTALSIGHSFANHKMLLSVVFYFVLYCANQLLGLLMIVATVNSRLVQDLLDTRYMQQVFLDTHLLMGLVIGVLLVLSAIYYILTTVMLKRKLNLA